MQVEVLLGQQFSQVGEGSVGIPEPQEHFAQPIEADPYGQCRTYHERSRQDENHGDGVRKVDLELTEQK